MNYALSKIYSEEPEIIEVQKERYLKLRKLCFQKFGDDTIYFFSAPGRTEIVGNHTDHNNGKVIAASINLDSIAAVSKNNLNKIILYSEGFAEPFEVDLDRLEKNNGEKGTTTALIRGIASRLSELGFKIGGFNGYMSSNIPSGSGLSSSASVEALIGSIFNSLFNESNIPYETIAKIGQYAENNYFGKPCGLMDQIACLHGGVVTIDFMNHDKPVITKTELDFTKFGYSIVIVDTGGNHADLTDDYASIPKEMKLIAEVFGEKVLRHVDEEVFYEKIYQLRKSAGDRAVLRAVHYFEENKRVAEAARKLLKYEFDEFLKLINESGDSSCKLLQNIYTNKNVNEQGVSLALALTDKYIKQAGSGASRVHGGGFAGTVQVYLKNSSVDQYRKMIENVFGENSAITLSIRSVGTVMLENIS